MFNCHLTTPIFIAICIASSGCRAEETGHRDNASYVTGLELSEGDKSFAVSDFNNDGHSDGVFTLTKQRLPIETEPHSHMIKTAD